MNLLYFDNKLIRITDVDDNQFEGFCSYNNIEFNECEYGTNEESLDITYIKFYKSIIKKVEIIHKFSNEYGKLEQLIVDSGEDLIDEVFESEDNKHIYRLLKYIDDKNVKVNKELLLKILKNKKEKEIINLVKNILERK